MVQAVSRAIRAAGCANCRTSLLRSFTSIAGVQWPATQIRPRRPAATIQRTVRHLSSIPQNASKLVDDAAEADEEVNGVESIQQRDIEASENGEKSEVMDEEAIIEEEELLEEDALLDEEASTSAETQSTSSTPWYLQVDAPAAAIPSLSERQKIPELPASSPAILEPLLNRISIDLGLDDLSLLDLRKLDPPPALGANLIMIVGTARSEKHLHVSADRLCRWLRTEYKLRPDADGLLGRNELKLKLKRKAKKAKLVGSVPHEDDADDGVRTGWVCVNVGTVESAELEATGLDKGFVGFGRMTEGTKIVVQMLVEEKRVELDLERLWSGISKRQSSGLPLDADIEEDVVETLATGESQDQARSLGTSPVIKVHDAYASPFPTTTSFSPMAVEDRGSSTKSEAS